MKQRTTSRRSKRLTHWDARPGDCLVELRNRDELILWSGPTWEGSSTKEFPGIAGRRWLIVSREPKGWTRIMSGTGQGVVEGWLEDRATTTRLWRLERGEE